MPNLDGKYLFGDYETTLEFIKIADRNTSRFDAPLYSLWLLSENGEELFSVIHSIWTMQL